jgi:hypothetical protein
VDVTEVLVRVGGDRRSPCWTTGFDTEEIGA